MFTLYPAIDLKGGRCVRLTQGRADAATIYRDNPAEVAGEFAAAGAAWIHVVDLDGAFTGAPQNAAAVAAIAKVLRRACSWAAGCVPVKRWRRRSAPA